MTGIIVTRWVNKMKDYKQLYRDEQQRAFENWFYRVCPSGDCDSVHSQWLESSDYEDFIMEYEGDLT